MGGSRTPAQPPQASDSDRKRPIWYILEDVSRPLQVNMASSPQPSPPPVSLLLHRAFRKSTEGTPTPGLDTKPKQPASRISGPQGFSRACERHHLRAPGCPLSPPRPSQQQVALSPPGACCHRTASHAIPEPKAGQWPHTTHVKPP